MAGEIGSEANPLRVAIFGAGPAGFYAVEELLKQEALKITVDLLDRLPTPYGLVRGGVAPDHQKIKAVIRQYEKIASRPGFRFFGNVTFGEDLSLAEVCPSEVCRRFDKDRYRGLCAGSPTEEQHQRDLFARTQGAGAGGFY